IDPRVPAAAVDEARARRRAAVAERELARRSRRRAEQLFREGIISRESLEEIVARAEAAEAAVRSAEAAVAGQRARVQFHEVTAPVAGVVGDVPVKRGDYVTPQTELTSVAGSTQLELSVAVPASRAADVKPGRTRLQVLDEAGGVLAEARAFFVAPTPDPTTQLVEVKAVLAPEPSLRAEQLVRARVVYDVYEGLRIPAIAVSRQSGQPFVFRLERAEQQMIVRRAPVRLGRLDGEAWEVVEGLKRGDRVASNGLQALRDGAPVRAVMRDEEASERGVGGAGQAEPRGGEE
ncbi:MAG: efflux RND transporter periplasmic adaptor subunit, partial [Myxococcales bacterium]